MRLWTYNACQLLHMQMTTAPMSMVCEIPLGGIAARKYFQARKLPIWAKIERETGMSVTMCMAKFDPTLPTHEPKSVTDNLTQTPLFFEDNTATATATATAVAAVTLLKPGIKNYPKIPNDIRELDHAIWQGDVEKFLAGLPREPLFDLIVTSPPYNIGKEYEVRTGMEKYLEWQERVISELIPRLKPGGSICWQVGNYVDDNEIFPLDIEFAPIFKKYNLRLRNRIIWQFGHGLHNQKRFSGRYEVVLWYTHSEAKKDSYTFNLDPVRIAAKYPGKKHFKGPNAGQLSGNPLGKNPEDVWNIPNVKSNHIEKTEHPCQFPVGLIERLVLALTNPGDLVFDPFSGVASSGVAAAIHGRRFWGCEPVAEYAKAGAMRIDEALKGEARYRPHDKPLYDHTQSNLSKAPAGFKSKEPE